MHISNLSHVSEATNSLVVSQLELQQIGNKKFENVFMKKPPDIVVHRFSRFLRELNEIGINGNPPMSEEELSKIFRKSQSSISNYLRASIGTITSDIILVAVHRFKVNPWYFYGPYHDERHWRDFPSDEERLPNNELMKLEGLCNEALKVIKDARNRRNLRPVPKPRKGD